MFALSRKEAQTVSQNLFFFKFYCLLHVSAFGEAITRQSKIKIQEDILHPHEAELPLHA